MKAYIAEQLNAGKKYNEILEEVKREMDSIDERIYHGVIKIIKSMR